MKITDFDKSRLPIVIVVLILAAGLYLRLYHISYPPIGFHSMKEVHYLSVAKGYLDHGDFAHKRVLYSGLTEGEGYMESFPQFPFLPFIYYFLWKIFGVHVWMARLVVIAFSLGTIFLAWRVAEKLTKNSETGLLASFLMMIMPVSIFFGRNIQPDIPALFFLLLLFRYFLEWIEDFRLKDLVGFSVCLLMVAMIKGTFLFPVMTIAFLFPYKRLSEKETRRTIFRQSAWFVAGISLIILWLLMTKAALVSSDSLFPTDRLLLAKSFRPGYWKTVIPVIWGHIGKNYTYLYFSFFFVGLLSCLLNWRSMISRFLAGSLVSAILCFVLISDFAFRHSYYHIPFLPMMAFGVAVGLSEAISILDRPALKKFRLIALAVFVLAAAPFLKKEYFGHFDILALGSDIAGRHIAEHGEKDDRIFISYASPSDRRYAAYRTQLYGTLWEAGKRGNLLPDKLEKIRAGEDLRNFRWILLYSKKWLPADAGIRKYINENYHVAQVGYRDSELLYYLLKRGGSLDLSRFKNIEPDFAGRYHFSFGDIDILVKE
ncbi:MAG: glycosyltransferase family 39 protein [Bacteroidales bacterium]|nr:glycosyltransferase family 39 protein [Candidatus Latescibacterota bacterium]